MKKNYKLQNTNKKTKGGHGLPKDSSRLQTMTAFNQKFLRGGLNQWASGSVGQCVNSMIGKRSYEPLIMMPRPHPETNESQHKRFAQHIGSPRRGAWPPEAKFRRKK